MRSKKTGEERRQNRVQEYVYADAKPINYCPHSSSDLALLGHLVSSGMLATSKHLYFKFAALCNTLGGRCCLCFISALALAEKG